MSRKLDNPSDLEDRHIKIMKFMHDHPECDTATDIPGAGERTLDIMTEKKVIRAAGKNDAGHRRFVLTKLGQQELRNIQAWELDSAKTR